MDKLSYVNLIEGPPAFVLREERQVAAQQVGELFYE